MDEKHSQLWQKLSAALKPQVSPDTFKRWFSAVRLVSATDETFTFRVPNNIYQFWIESNHMSALQAAIVAAFGSPRDVKFVTASDSGSKTEPEELPEISPKEFVRESARDGKQSGPALGLNPRNNFESFVVGPNNEIAHAASLAVAKTPARTYNPLFIYGGVGLGKTHLMQAIGQYVGINKKGAKVMYLSSEVFINEFIDAIQHNNLVKFRKRYRQADLLLIDDIQFLGGKERSQEEFFHTFNTLFDGHKQIVLSSDRPPSEIGNIEPRLVSRFEWGLTAELQAPEMETRAAILKKKAAGLGIKLSPEVLLFIAENIRTNIRRLEGALMRVAMLTSLGGPSPSMERIELLLKDLLAEEARRSVNVEQIQKSVAEHFDVRFADMTSKRRPKNIAFPRQIAMYIAREITKSSLMEIGDAFGGRDHGTVLHAHRLVKARIASDEKIRQVVKFLQDQLQR